VARELIQVVAAVMAATNTALWILSTRWERPGSNSEIRTRLRPPARIRRGGDLAQVAPLAYPLLVVVAPAWVYEGPWNWTTEFDPVLQGVGVLLWGLGVVLAAWAAWAIRAYLAVEGVTTDHHLVSDGPYRYVRHPVYTSLMSIALGTALVFRSYLLLGVAALSIASHLWWAAAEEKLLGSDDGLGHAYVAYASRTGRFLPRMRRAR
jgi:protein-S-isoprenylcysteine O-methyltransferase Ste14